MNLILVGSKLAWLQLCKAFLGAKSAKMLCLSTISESPRGAPWAPRDLPGMLWECPLFYFGIILAPQISGQVRL